MLLQNEVKFKNINNTYIKYYVHALCISVVPVPIFNKLI